MQKIAVIADPHFHDITYRPGSHSGPHAAIRTLADTVESTRVFNESFHALTTLLDDIVRRGIRIVVVAGDLSDDGQASTMAAACALLNRYAERHSLRFFATPGNHDLYAIHGRHQSKRFLDPDGTHTLVTSDGRAPRGASRRRIVTAEMYCGGYEAALHAMAPFGFFRDTRDLRWETPFGTSDDLRGRSFDIRSADGATVRRMIDASYLVEPIDGLWLLAVDANVFEPLGGDRDPTAEKSYIDSTDAGWNSMLRNKAFILDWMKDVAGRAERLGKRLLAFSHYPMIDPLNGTAEDEVRLLGGTSFVRRAPSPEVAEAGAATGIAVHFSGHLHINDTALARAGDRFLVNISVPSTVGFPPAYKIVEFAGNRLIVETVTIAEVAGFDAAFDLYRREAASAGADDDGLLDAASHADFLSRHLAAMVRHRYLVKEWPPELAALVPELDLADLWRIAGATTPLRPEDAARIDRSTPAPAWGTMPFMDLVVDWYRLRKGRGLALDFIASDRLVAYRRLAARFAAGSWQQPCLQMQLAGFFGILERYLASAPSRDFAVDLTTGAIVDLARDHLARTDLRQTGFA